MPRSPSSAVGIATTGSSCWDGCIELELPPRYYVSEVESLPTCHGPSLYVDRSKSTCALAALRASSIVCFQAATPPTLPPLRCSTE
jgi:hypothetical protein